jgi:hypothetical protein
MPATLMEKWADLFPGGSPDANRTASSNTSDAITNPLSDVSGLDNKYTSVSTLPTGRQSQSISVLWNHFCDVADDSDASINHLTTDFGVRAGEQNVANNQKAIGAMSKNVVVRSATDAIPAQLPQQFGQNGTAAVDAVVHATVKSNYRLGSVNPNGGFSSYTGRPMSNGGDDIATITLQQYRDGMG